MAAEKAACIKDKMSKFNPWTGLIHQPDGTKEFVDGGVVSGANGYNHV